MALASPPLLGWGVYDFLPGQSFCFCQWKTSISYTFFMAGICFGGPCSVMSFCYINILRTVRASNRRIDVVNINNQTIENQNPIDSGLPIQKTNTLLTVPGNEVQCLNKMEQARAKKHKQEELQLTRSFFVVITIFILCWLPFCVTMFMNVYSAMPVSRILDMITLLLGCLNSACNPIIYGIMNKKYRIAYTKLYCKLSETISSRVH